MKYRLFALSALSMAMSACTTVAPAPSVVLAEPNLPLSEPFTPVTAVAPNPVTASPVAVSPVTAPISAAPSVAGSRWQDFYDDDKLKALITLGLANNKNLEQATLAIQKVAAQYQIANANSLPSVGASGSYTHGGQRQLGQRLSSDSYNIGLGMPSYELDFWGKIAALKEQALQSYLATSAAKDSVQISLIANIAQMYSNISYTQAQIILAESTVKSREHSLYITQRRFQAGIDSRSPSLQAEASLENARLAVMNAKSTLLKQQNALQLLVGAPIPAELMPEPAITGLVSPVLLSAGLPSELLYYRPDIVQAEYTLKAAGANIDVARAAFFPNISLSGNIGLASDDLTKLFSSNALAWSFGPKITLPIFDAGARQANYDTAVLDQQQKLAAYEGTIQTAFREVNDVLATRAYLDAQLAAQYRLQKNYQQTYDIAYAIFRSGLANYLDVLDAERSLFAIQQQILNLELQKVLSQIELYQALGGGATLDATQIVDSATQTAAMTPARLASPAELETLSSTIPVTPSLPVTDTPSNLAIHNPSATPPLVIPDNPAVTTPNTAP